MMPSSVPGANAGVSKMLPATTSLPVVQKQPANSLWVQDVVAPGAGNAVRNIAVLTIILQQDNVCQWPRIITTRSAVKKRRDSRKRAIAPVGTAHIVVADGRRQSLRRSLLSPTRPPNLLQHVNISISRMSCRRRRPLECIRKEFIQTDKLVRITRMKSLSKNLHFRLRLLHCTELRTV